ncbi:hypothetical protein [Agitococcus lubricus]|uniref:Uncharacterized protein n=1 Tax=Agitococcus lubricus TaxID=1077255 RepID=A0A2T5J2C2_9GAMM|nr:hypothetical protein [Agitococcus lubricus]PTQ90668.1 hypothetical protein C8N29_10268 [Agitococcus lubricus]
MSIKKVETALALNAEHDLNDNLKIACVPDSSSKQLAFKAK